MITYKTISLTLAVLLAVFSGGCFGPNAKSAFLRERQGKTAADGDNEDLASSGKGTGDDVLDAAAYTPEESMRRDLARLREHESKQARLVKELQTELSDGRQIIADEEKRLAEIQDRIARYEDAMGGVGAGGSRLAQLRQRQQENARNYPINGDPFASENENRLPGEYDYFANRNAPANLARNPSQNTAYDDSMQEEVLYSSGGPAAGNNAAESYSADMNKFAGAPRGRARSNPELMQKVQAHEQREAQDEGMRDGELMVWNPNDPSQPIPPGVLASSPTATPAQMEQNRQEMYVARPTYHENTVNNLAAAPAAGRRPVQPDASELSDNPYGNYTSEVFSPDLLFGRGS